ncbi:MAG: hypothetical protein M1818_003826 [Claussenomyces sp. TS43310]|nr:MAG: hypothetical protein M1818_003826 [Claussenomyces sp. TS43310]
MPSGTFKDVTKAITTHIPTATLPLPDELCEILQEYLNKYLPLDDSESQKLHEELLTIHQKDVLGHRKRYAPFLAILRELRPAIARRQQLLQWRDILIIPVLNLLSAEKGLAAQTRALLIEILAPDPEEGNPEDAARTSAVLAEGLLEMWLEPSGPEKGAGTDVLRNHIHDILMEFGRKRPKEFLTAIDPLFVKKDSRCTMLFLIEDFIRQEPPHLHLVLETPLLGNLLRCLQLDTLTTVVSLALTALTMLLPHAPNGMGKHLPALLNIYARLLFWDRERSSETRDVDSAPLDDDDDTLGQSDQDWEILTGLSESEDTQVPQLLPFFTFLYGLYPINFMSYIRKPSRYLRHAAPEADDIDVQSTEIRQRSERFRRLHLLHPNFFSTTIESELSDRNRWQKSMPADVTATCVALYYPSLQSGRSSPARPADLSTMPDGTQSDADDGLPEHSMLAQDEGEEPNASWRYTTSTIVETDGSSETCEVGRKGSMGRIDSPTLPPQTSTASHEAGEKTDNQSQSISDAGESDYPKVTSLRKEIMLLKNDLNFERYLKQQHLVHIGQLRRRHVREATIESETQNLLNANRALKSKLEEARNIISQTKKEAEKSRSHAKKWEAELITKLRAVREEQKKLASENETLKGDLSWARNDFASMKQLIVDVESRELLLKQKLQSVQANGDELDGLRKEIEKLTTALHDHEAHEQENDVAKANEALAMSHVAELEMKLTSVTGELEVARETSTAEMERLKLELQTLKQESRVEQGAGFQGLLDNAMAASRSRLAEAQRARANLQRKYTELEAQYLSLKDLERKTRDEPLLSSSDPWGRQMITPTPEHRRNRSLSTMGSGSSAPAGSSSSGVHAGHARVRQGEGGRHSRSGSVDGGRAADEASGKGKISAQGEQRIYGRGGVQNIGKKEKKDKGKDKGKDKAREEQAKKEKKSGSLRGIRGLV